MHTSLLARVSRYSLVHIVEACVVRQYMQSSLLARVSRYSLVRIVETCVVRQIYSVIFSNVGGMRPRRLAATSGLSPPRRISEFQNALRAGAARTAAGVPSARLHTITDDKYTYPAPL